MVVNSFSFLIFFIVVFIVYYLPVFKKSARFQNWILLVSSYFFYTYADWRMVPLLLAATVVFYFLGIWLKKKIDKENWKAVSKITILGVVLGVGILFYFKYFNFFADSIAQLLSACGLNVSWTALNIVIPIGVSFFTFKLISYVLEVSNEVIEPTRDFVDFAVYVAFFPTLLSGPIDRANRFLPQLLKRRTLIEGNLSEGLKRILWGLFLKMCIADRLSPWTDAVFNNYAHHNATSIIMASVLYLFQIYSDFCGYSEMAIGVSRILGISVAENFRRPFFAQNIAEYWRRWHISLTSWITDYIFTPLNYTFRDLGRLGVNLAIMINLVVIGMWHGANWTYILFGFYHGFIFIIVGLLEKKRLVVENKYGLKSNEIYKWSRRLLTFVLCSIGIVIFRVSSVYDFWGIIQQVGKGFGKPFSDSLGLFTFGLLSILILFIKETVEEYNNSVKLLRSQKTYVRILTIIALIIYIVYAGELNGGQFIYFQF